MIGAIIGTALLNILFGAAYIPRPTKVVVQIIAGSFIGCSIKRSDVKRLPMIIKPMLIMLGGFFALNIVAGFVIHAISPLDWATAFMSAVPGGVSDTPIIASDMGADAPKVAVMQTVRLIFGLGVFPSLILAWDTRRPQPHIAAPQPVEKKEKHGPAKTRSWKAVVATFGVTGIAGLLGRQLPIPAGAFIFAIVAALVLKLVFNFAYIPTWVRKCAQVLSGCYIGASIFLNDVLEMRFLVLPLLVIIVGYMANCFLTGKLIQRTCGFSRRESMLVTIPAGASDMALIAADLGIENPDIIILQVIRLVAVMTLFPQMIHLLLVLVAGA
jgi:membrane AbrB-like protein